MCCNQFSPDGIRFPDFTRYACCNPCCQGGVSAQRVESNDDDNCGCGCGCCCCCRCCHCGCGCQNGNVGGTNTTPPCPCRGGW